MDTETEILIEKADALICTEETPHVKVRVPFPEEKEILDKLDEINTKVFDSGFRYNFNSCKQMQNRIDKLRFICFKKDDSNDWVIGLIVTMLLTHEDYWVEKRVIHEFTKENFENMMYIIVRRVFKLGLTGMLKEKHHITDRELLL